jgi:sugar phosphate permease
MLLGAAGMLYLTGTGPHSSYAAHLLPALIVLGLGFGIIFAPALQTATLNVAGNESGIASAMVNTSQQVGGSIGLALLSTIAVTATRHSLSDHRPTPTLIAHATVHGNTTAFYISAAIFALGALTTGLLLRPKSRTPIPTRDEASAITSERPLA